MSVDLTKQNFSQTFLYVIILILVFWSREIFFGYPLSVSSDLTGMMPLARIIDQWLASFEGLDVLLSVFFLFVNSFFVTRIVIKNVIFLNNTYVTALLYMAFCSSMVVSSQSYIYQIVTFLSLNAIENILRIYKRTNVVSQFFRGALYFGVAFLLYAPLVAVVVIMCVNMVIFGRDSYKELVALVVGFFVPAFMYSYINWIANGDFFYLYNQFLLIIESLHINPMTNNLDLSIVTIVYYSLIIAIILFALVVFFRNRLSERSRMVKSYGFMVGYLILNSMILAWAPTLYEGMIPLLSISSTVIVAVLFKQISHKVMVNIIYIIIIMGSLAVNFK